MSKVLDYPLTEAKAEIVDGERSQEAIVNTEPQGCIVDTALVKEIKRLIEEYAREGEGVTQEELEQAIAGKADKIGGLPYFEVKGSDKVIDFILANNLNHKPIIIGKSDKYYIGTFTKLADDMYAAEFEDLSNANRYYGSFGVTNLTFDQLLGGSFKLNYLLEI